ncbi:MAG TPA: hypothetical protein VGI12_07550 [Vicinamibacterales bacterium]|jgi:hypothetical protein
MIAMPIVYHDVPAEVSTVTPYAWRQGSAPVPLHVAVERDGRDVRFVLAVESPIVVLLQRPDGLYLLDGPLIVDRPLERRVDGNWRRSVVGSTAGVTAAAAPLTWISADGIGGVWPACWWTSPSRWECMGLPLDAAGVVTAIQDGWLLAAPVSGNAVPTLRASAWGRLAVVSDRDGGLPPRLRFTAAEPQTPPQRARAVRLETRQLDLKVFPLSPGVFWLAGGSSPPDSWLEVRSVRSGPQFLSLDEVARDTPLSPLRVVLEARRDVDAVVASNRGDPIPGALVTLFRLIDRQPEIVTPGQPPPRRVLAGEWTTASDGKVVVESAGEADYEIVAWHPQFGRTSLRLRPGVTAVSIRLQPAGVAGGRVLSGGRPAAGVDVISAPDPSAYAAATDPIEVKGGEARTGSDGRFAVALAPDGGGELRIGGAGFPTVRVPLPRAPLPLIELGDIELGRPIAVSIALDQETSCDLKAAGPVGRSGLQIVAASRTGPGLFSMVLPEEGTWEFVLICGREERSLVPSILTVSARDGPRDLRLSVR